MSTTAILALRRIADRSPTDPLSIAAEAAIYACLFTPGASVAERIEQAQGLLPPFSTPIVLAATAAFVALVVELSADTDHAARIRNLEAALDDIRSARARYGASGFPVGLYPDPVSWMETRAEQALDGKPSPFLTRVTEGLIDAAANLAAASSAYRNHASRHRSAGRATPDPFFKTRAADFEHASDRVTAIAREVIAGVKS